MTEERTTESPPKWWKSKGDMPTVKEVVERLRAEGNLDEKKWEGLEKKKLNYIFWFSVFFILASIVLFDKNGGWIASVIILSYASFVIIGILKDKTIGKAALLYSFGVRTKGRVLYAKSDPSLNRGMPNQYIYRYEYVDAENIKHEFLFEPIDYQMAEASRPQVGDEIDIIYMESNPEITMPVLKYLDNKLNLRKGINDDKHSTTL